MVRSYQTSDIPWYATLYLLQVKDPARPTKEFHSEDLKIIEDLVRVDEDQRKKVQGGNANQILFLRGFPSPEWLCQVGWYYVVDPEFFRRHLDMSLLSHQQWFSSPSLPSTTSTFVQLRITTIARRKHGYPNIEEARREAMEDMASYLQGISEPDYKGDLGDSIVRKTSLHDEHYFSLEQDISICCCKSGKGWTLIAWLDSGKDLTKGRAGPWMKTSTKRDGVSDELKDLEPFDLISTIRNEPNKVIHPSESGRRNQELAKRAQRFRQSRALLNLDYGRHFDDLEVYDDAFYAILPIFKYKAYAESQFLNLIHSVLQQAVETIRFTKSGIDAKDKDGQYFIDLRKSHENFAYHKEILESHIRQTKDNLRSIKARGGTQWPRCTIAEKGREKVQAAIDTLHSDFEWLKEQAQGLSDLCDRAMQDIHDKSILEESLKSNEQAEKVNQLSSLATFMSVFYIPLSFTSGFFGMNFSAFGQGHAPFWLYPVVSVPILVVSILFMYSKHIVRMFKKASKTSVPKKDGGTVNKWSWDIRI